MHKHIWRQANIRMIPAATLFLVSAIFSHVYGNIRSGDLSRQLAAIIGVVVFIVFAVVFLHVFTRAVRRIISAHHLGAGRAASIQFSIRLTGYVAILVATLGLLDIPIGRLLLGGAALGIILGVAAQQALANFFASIVLIISHPFTVGEDIVLTSGALGGKYVGRVLEIGLTHTRLRDEDDNIIFLPNATLLAGAAIMAKPGEKTPPPSQHS